MKYLKILPALFVVIIILFSISCQNCIEGKGGIVRQKRDLKAFSKIEVNIPADVVIGEATKPVMQIHAQPNVLKAITTEVNGDELIIDASPCLKNIEPVSIRIMTPALTGITFNGSGSLKTDDIFTCDRMEIEMNGSGRIYADVFTNKVDVIIKGSGMVAINGTTNDQSVEIMGSGIYKGFGLKSYRTEVDLKGSGTAEVIALNKLNVNITGSGEVVYSGNPDLKTKIKGSGKVSKME